MNIAFIGKLLDVLGKVMLGLSVLNVHRRVLKEHKIDKAVFHEMKQESIVTVIGIVLIVIGFLLQVPKELHLDLF